MAIKVFSPIDFEDTSSGLSIDGDLAVDTDVLYVDTDANIVGIGTTSPVARLTIAASTNDGVSLESNNALLGNTGSGYTQLIYWNGSSMFYGRNTTGVPGGSGGTVDNHVFRTNGATRMQITNSGNVGIGTTSPSSKIHSKGELRVDYNNTDGSTYVTGYGVEFERGTNYLRPRASDGTQTLNLGAADDSLDWNNINFKTSSHSQFRVAGSDIMRINSTGVGIGTVSPSAKLHVQSGVGIFNVSDDWHQSSSGTHLFRGGEFNSSINEDSTAIKVFNASGTTGKAVGNYWGGISFMHLDPQYSSWGTTFHGDHFWIGGRLIDTPSQERSALVFATNNSSTAGSHPTEKMVIMPNGNVGIGTTSPDFKLDVAGDIGIDGKIYHNGDHNTYIGFSGDTQTFRTGGSDRVTINNTGVGIGTTSPSYKLDVNGDARVNGNLHLDSRGDFITFYGNENADHSISSRDIDGDPSDDLRINSYGSVFVNLDSNSNGTDGVFLVGQHGDGSGTIVERFRIQEDGNVGIGTSSPAEKLHVDGTARFTDSVRIDTTGTALEITGTTTVDGSDVSMYLGNSPSSYGYYITYVGSGSGNANAFKITSTNAGTPKTLLTSNQDGIVNFPTGLQLNGAGVATQSWVSSQGYVTSLSGYATESYVNTQVSNLVDSAPGALDTLNELAAALGDDANFSTTVTNSIATKLPLAGGTITGNLTINGSAEFNGLAKFDGDIDNYQAGAPAVYIGLSDGIDPQIQLQGSGGSDRPHIDFANGASEDYDARIILDDNNTLTVDGATLAVDNHGNSAQWNTAYGWGNHASAGYSTATGVENNADVTDATNVAAAGALMRSGGTMTGDLRVTNGDNNGIRFHSGGANITSVVSGDVVIQRLTQGLRFGSVSSWDYNEWAGIKFDSSSEILYIGGPAASQFSSNSNPPTIDVNFVGVDEVQIGGNAIATESYVDTQIDDLVDSAPGALDTLNELAAALGDDANFSTTVTNSIATKLPLAGGTMSGTLNMSNNALTNISYLSLGNKEKDNLPTGEGAIIYDFNDGDAPASLGDYGGSHPDGVYLRSSSSKILTVYHTGHFTGTHIANWQTAYGWGDHASAGYLTSETYTAHEDTSTLSGTYGSTSNGTKIDQITVDSNGHITAITTGNTGDILGITAGAGLSGGGSSGGVTVSSVYLPAEDDRDVKPSTTDITASVKGIKPFFTSFNGMTGSNGGAYLDMLAFDTYSDSSGGGPSAITFHKGESVGNPKMYIWKGAWGGTTWGTGQRVFADNYHPNADKWTTARTLTLSGDVTGSVSWDGSANASITTTIADDSHNHVISNIDGLQTALDGKLGTSAKAADSSLLDGIDSGSFLRSDADDTTTGTLTIGNGSNQARLLIKKADNNTSNHIEFYNGTTRVGEIGAGDNTYLRINQETSKNIYTPRYMRADGGFFVDGTSKGINGSGNFIGGTITGASDANVSNWDTAYGWGDHASAGYATSAQGTKADNALPKAGGTMTGTLKVTGSVIHENNGSSGYIPFPKGAMFQTSTASHTGAIKIKLPTHGTADMMTFVVEIFDYDTNESVTLFIAGYLYQTTNNNEWVNCTVRTLANETDKDYTVRFGADGSNNCVWIGETNSAWSYPQVMVRDFFAAYTTDIDAYDDNWDITIVTSFDTVDETISDNFPAADWDRIKSKPSTFAPSAHSAALLTSGTLPIARIADDAITGAKIAHNTLDAIHINASAVGASELNVSGNGSSGQVLTSDGDGTFSWTNKTVNTNTNYYLDGITKSGNTLTFSVNGATNQTYTFGSNAFNSTTIPTNNNQLTNGAGYITDYTVTSSDVTTALGYTPYQESTALSATTGTFSGDITVNGNQVITTGSNADVKFSVWSGTTYGIGMRSGVTYGGLNDYAMTFCMNNDSDRGFWWGYSGQSKSSGAMSLTTAGVLTVASSITAGGAVTGSNLNVSNWDTAYGWGNHASAGYITGYTETDTLDSVTDRGATTTNSITASGMMLGDVHGVSGYSGIKNSSVANSGYALLQYTSGYTLLNSGSGQPVDFRIGNSQAMRLSTSKNLLIGTTTDNGDKLQVSGNAYISGDLEVDGTISGYAPSSHTHVISDITSLQSTLDGKQAQGLLDRNGLITTNDWNDFYTNDALRVVSAHNFTAGSNNAPDDNYNYGAALTYRRTSNEAFQMYFPENNGDSTNGNRRVAFRTGWNGGWSSWRRFVDMIDNVGYVTGGNDTGFEVHSDVGYNQDPGTYFLLRGQADNNQPYALKILLTGNANGNDIEWRRLKYNGSDERMYYAPEGADQITFEYTVVTPSDARLKDNVKNISNPIEKLSKLNGCEFDWNSGVHEGKHDIGVIAQEVEAVIPEAVGEGSDGIKSVAYDKLVPLLIESVKEQQAMIEELKQEIKNLKNK